MMLDAKRTFDELIARLAPDANTRDQILDNRIYRHLSTAVAGSQEYTAIAKLFELEHQGDYETIVLDTPPSRSAIDFLDAPERLIGFLGARALSPFLAPTRARAACRRHRVRGASPDHRRRPARGPHDVLPADKRTARWLSHARHGCPGTAHRSRHRIRDRDLSRRSGARRGHPLRRTARARRNAPVRRDCQPRPPARSRRTHCRDNGGETDASAWRPAWEASRTSPRRRPNPRAQRRGRAPATANSTARAGTDVPRRPRNRRPRHPWNRRPPQRTVQPTAKRGHAALSPTRGVTSTGHEACRTTTPGDAAKQRPPHRPIGTRPKPEQVHVRASRIKDRRRRIATPPGLGLDRDSVTKRLQESSKCTPRHQL